MKVLCNIIINIVAFLFCVSAAMAKAHFNMPSPKVETLANGLQIAWFLDEKLPLLDLAVLVKSGNRDDPKGQSGVSEVVSDLLERGVQGQTPVQFAQRVESLGAEVFTASDDDSISFGVHGLSSDAAALLEIVSAMALKPNFDEKEFNRVKALTHDRWSHLADTAESLAGFVFARALTAQTSYGRGSLWSLHELNALKLSHVKNFYKKHFTPQNSILMVVGRVDQKQFKEKIIQYFDAWKGDAPGHQYQLYQNIEFRGEPGELLLIDRSDLPQAQIRLGFRVPSVLSTDRHALAVTNALLGEYFNSRLNLKIRDQLGMSYGVQSSLTYAQQIAYLTISTATQSQNVGRVLKEIQSVLEDLKTKGPTEAEVNTAKSYLEGSFPLSMSTLSAVATRWLSGVIFGLGPDFLNEFLPKVASVKTEDATRAFQSAYQTENTIVVVAGDLKSIQDSLQLAGYKKTKRIADAAFRAYGFQLPRMSRTQFRAEQLRFSPKF